MAEITTPRDLFLHELGDIMYVERAALDRGPAEARLGGPPTRSSAPPLEQHLEQTKRHLTNVEKVFEELGETPHAEECIGFEGLRAEHDKLMGEASSDLVDSIDLGAAARTECYEIAAYEGLRRMAKAMGEDRAVELLDRNLEDEKDALKLVEKIATRVSKESAQAIA